MKNTWIALLLVAALMLTVSGCAAAPAAAPEFAAYPTEQPPEPAPSPQNAAPLSPEDAQAIALSHAGFTADAVERMTTEYEIDDGIPQFDVEFHQGDWEYEFEIHAETGKILSFDKDSIYD